jgi:hypothetical protein
LISELKLANGVVSGRKKKKPKKPRKAAVAASAAISAISRHDNLVMEAEGDASVTAVGKPPLHDNIGIHITIVCSDIFLLLHNPSTMHPLFCSTDFAVHADRSAHVCQSIQHGGPWQM